MINVNVFNQYDTSIEYHEILKEIISMSADYFKLADELVVNFILVDDDEIQSLNQQYRNLDQPTDVLSFDNQDSKDELGDIFISIDRAKAQAKAYQHSFERELAFLALHGFLHCMGYDHMTKDQEEEMFSIQDEIIENSQFRRDEHYEK